MKTEDMTATGLVDSLKKEFSNKIKDIRIDIQKSGVKKTEYAFIWLTVHPNDYKALVKHLFTVDKYPHFNYDLCIRCFCCSEGCKVGAVKVKSSKINRIINKVIDMMSHK